MKLSEMPVNSLIDSKEGLFLKDQKFVWLEVFPHCSECQEKVDERGVDSSEVGPYVPNFSTELPAEEYFGAFKVLAIGVSEGD